MKTLYTISVFVTVFGALLWAFQAVGLNLVHKFISMINLGNFAENIIYYFISLCALIFLILFLSYKDYNED